MKMENEFKHLFSVLKKRKSPADIKKLTDLEDETLHTMAILAYF